MAICRNRALMATAGILSLSSIGGTVQVQLCTEPSFANCVAYDFTPGVCSTKLRLPPCIRSDMGVADDLFWYSELRDNYCYRISGSIEPMLFILVRGILASPRAPKIAPPRSGSWKKLTSRVQ